MDLMSLTAVELGKKIKAKEVSVEEAVRAALAAIGEKEDAVNSFVTVDEEGDRCWRACRTACGCSGRDQG